MPGESRDRMSILNTQTDVPVHYVNDALYQRLANFAERMRGESTIAESLAGDEVKRLLFLESRLLDNRNYEKWLDVFAPELIYWVPMMYEPGNPKKEPSIYLDDRRRLGDRVGSILTGSLHAQDPPSRTRRMLSNLEQWDVGEEVVGVRGNVVIWEYRKFETRSYAGTQEYELVRDAGRLQIRTKIVRLLNSDAPQGNYSFII